jgi:hypothetical protein
MELSQLIPDEDKVTNGAWVHVEKDFSVKVRPWGTSQYKKAFSVEMQIARQKQRPAEGSLEFYDDDHEIMANALAKGAVIDWKGVTEEGTPIPYDAEIFAGILRKNHVLASAVFDATKTQGLFRVELEKDAEKN